MPLWSRFYNAVLTRRLDREIGEELESHIAEAVERGRNPEEVRRAFGSRLRTRAQHFGWAAGVDGGEPQRPRAALARFPARGHGVRMEATWPCPRSQSNRRCRHRTMLRNFLPKRKPSKASAT